MPRILGKAVGSTGYGLMGLTFPRIEPTTEQAAFQCLDAAVKNGSSFWNGGDFYGVPGNTSLELMNKYFSAHPEVKDKVFLSMKGGMDMSTFSPKCSPESIKANVDNCLTILDGKKSIDVYLPARIDPEVPVEETISALAEYVKAGKIGGIMLCEAKSETIRRAHKVHPLAGVEVELSIWATDSLTNGVAATCAELGIPLIAYSPMGQGILSGQIKSLSDIPEGDYRRMYPRFQPDVFGVNLELVDEVVKIAKKKHCTPTQLALSWVKARSRQIPGLVVIPIPGASKPERVIENSVEVPWTDEDEKDLQSIIDSFPISGTRYPEMSMKFLDG